jgi:DNA-binding PadR family transcriptional regulator
MAGVTIRTELEYCALGVIWQRGPCSAYTVRSEFAKSPSAHWSASAGSIYPVVSRLLAAGLITARPLSTGRRSSQELRVTGGGLDALRGWIGQIDKASTSATYDSVRTRLLFLQALQGRAERESVLDKALEETKARLAELRALAEADEPIEALATLGAVYELEARLAWLTEIGPRLLR